jgi:hypothetical protein
MAMLSQTGELLRTGSGMDEHWTLLVALLLIIIFSLYCCTGWGYIEAFTKVFTMYKILKT